MNKIIDVFDNIVGIYNNMQISTVTVITILLVVAVLAAYEFVIYRFVSHRSFYSKQFNILIAILPFFISTIILCLQADIVITLGTIGALAIIRFRTTVKDPVDMLYLLWSVYIGIICGCQLFEVAILTSIIVTIAFFILENVTFGRPPYVIIIHSENNTELEITSIIKKNAKNFRIKSRNYSSSGMDYAIEARIKDCVKLTNDLKKSKKVKNFSIIEYDADDIV